MLRFSEEKVVLVDRIAVGVRARIWLVCLPRFWCASRFWSL
ncbi:hypothetical protein GWL_22660 [Herbaspirillum sp. GW103]|nr:hypothetical protein GWL_22660 [Herbaspirillum sp. GW103]